MAKMTQGETLQEAQPVTHEFYRTQLVAEGKISVVDEEIFIYDGLRAETPPIYRDQGMSLVPLVYIY